MTIDTSAPGPTAVGSTFVARLRLKLSPAPSQFLFDVRSESSRLASELENDPVFLAELANPRPPRPAAVLVPIVMRQDPMVLLTQRTEHLPNHAGQIAFPGGKIEPDDTDAVAAAMREAREEIGLDRSHVEPLGYLDSMRTHTGFHIYPVVAAVRPDFDLNLDPSEVADAFEVPLAFLMNRANHQRKVGLRNGVERYYYEMPFGKRFIWGVTAAILRNLSLRLTD